MKKLFIVLSLCSAVICANKDFYFSLTGANRIAHAHQADTISLMRHSFNKVVPGAGLSLKESQMLGQKLMANTITAPLFGMYSYLIYLGASASAYEMLLNFVLTIKYGSETLFDFSKYCCNGMFKTEFTTNAKQNVGNTYKCSRATVRGALRFGAVTLFGLVPLKILTSYASDVLN